MKKILFVIVSLMLVLTACGGGGNLPATEAPGSGAPDTGGAESPGPTEIPPMPESIVFSSNRGADPNILDLYLIGTVLIITAVGLYELFIGDVTLPGWLVIRSLSDLKTKIVEVIVLVIGIKFLEKLVTVKDPIDLLWYGLGSAVVMGVLIGWNSLKSAK